jgi:hypothetical protein
MTGSTRDRPADRLAYSVDEAAAMQPHPARHCRVIQPYRRQSRRACQSSAPSSHPAVASSCFWPGRWRQVIGVFGCAGVRRAAGR